MAIFFEELTKMLLKGEDLPSLPDVVLQLHGALDDDMVGDAQIADIVERDPAIAARLLRISNSALLSRRCCCVQLSPGNRGLARSHRRMKCWYSPIPSSHLALTSPIEDLLDT